MNKEEKEHSDFKTHYKYPCDIEDCKEYGEYSLRGSQLCEKHYNELKEKEPPNEFEIVEKFIPPRNIRCKDCIANPIPKLINEFKKIIDKTIILMKKRYGYTAKGNEYLEKSLNQELKDLKRREH